MDSEREQVLRAARGDAAAFESLWLSHRDAVYRFACWMWQNSAAAEDITQECFLCLLQHPARFSPERGSLRTFLLAVARNQCRIRWRQLAPELPLDDDVEDGEALERLSGVENAALLTAAIAKLPLLQREAIFLFEYEELSLEQAAAVVHTDIGTFKSRLYRARQRLKRHLEPLYGKGFFHGTRP